MRIESNGAPYFDTETGGIAAFDQGDLGSGPLASFDSSRVDVYYADNHSTVPSQDEGVVMARSPSEFRAFLESLHGDDVNDWLVGTFDPNDPFPNQVPNPPNGIELPFAQSFAFPNQVSSPTTRWPMTRGMFTGSQLSVFDGPAAQFGGSTKAIWLLRRGVCSFVEQLGGAQGFISQILAAAPSDNGLPGFFDKGAVFGVVDHLLASAYVSRENLATPTGGISLLTAAHGTWRFPPVGTFEFNGNFTYPFVLQDGILATDNIENEYDYGGADPFGLGTEFFSDNFATGVGDTVYLQALSQQSQPIPNPNAPPGADCSTANGSKPPPSCFLGCSDANGFVMTDPSTWRAPPDPVGGFTLGGLEDYLLYSYAVDFCQPAASLLSSATEEGAGTYGITDQNTVQQLGELITAPRPAPNDDKFHNVRCNFDPTYEQATVPTGNVDASGNPILVPKPTCEIVVRAKRAKRINVLPDTLELVFFDGSNLNSVTSDEFDNEAFAVYLALLAKAPSSIVSMCARQPEAQFTSAQREFAHGHFIAQ